MGFNLAFKGLKTKLVKKFSRMKCIMHWLYPLFYAGAKFGPLEKRIKSIDINRYKNFSEKQAECTYLTTKEMKKVWKSGMQNQLTRNSEDTNQIGYDM
jgi:hypothetical protein